MFGNHNYTVIIYTCMTVHVRVFETNEKCVTRIHVHYNYYYLKCIIT